ncbi:hypothetical protein [Shouchella hunanensis]|uniref:Uncharacterized protein n=1 Tax=Shouchella hunanensis TaxID=766894 RepID=A0ABY7W678_9BACI|nr:hypothetical protein [Shouchella hunanensis]WDF03370.1 hypothetical protein PQ477_18030 [Shouchella hunanensis]
MYPLRKLELHNKLPQLKASIEQLQETIPSSATQGAFMSVFPESRQQVVTAMENMFQRTEPEAVLEQAVEGTNRAIELYNRSNQ